VAINHRGSLFQPHLLWGVPTWPYHPKPGEDKTLVPSLEPKRGCVVYFATKKDINNLKRSLTNWGYHFFRLYQYPVYIFHSELSRNDTESIRRSVYTELNFIEVDSKWSRNSFMVKYFTESDPLGNYDYYMFLDPGTNLLADLHWDPFLMMAQYKFSFSFHRWHSPIANLEPTNNPTLWNKVFSIAGRIESFKNRRLPPENFYYSLAHFTIVNAEFLKNPNYKKLVSQLSDKDHIGHVWPLVLSVLDDSPWKKVADMTVLSMNWNTSLDAPFAFPSWWQDQTPFPPWPHKYSNRNPPC